MGHPRGHGRGGDSPPMAKSVAVRAADGKRGVWSLEKGGFRAIPGLESKDSVIGWTPDGESVYVAPVHTWPAKAVQVDPGEYADRENGAVGKLWGRNGGRRAPRDGTALTCRLTGLHTRISTFRTLSEAYVVKGLK